MRYASIDILRTVAIVLMVLVHFMENLAGADWAPAGLGAPLFTFLSGVSYRLWLNSREARGASETDISRVTVRRGLFLFGLGFAFNVLVWLPEDTFNWDVLTLIGCSLLVLNFARNLPLAVSVAFAATAFGVAPVLRAVTDYSSYWASDYFDGDWTLPDVIIGFLATGYFPVFPWVVYPVAGFVTASFLFPGPGESRRSVRPAAMVGAGLIVASILGALYRQHAPEFVSRHLLTGWTMFPPSVQYVLGTLGLALVLFAVLHQRVDLRPEAGEPGVVRSVAGTFSRHSLTIYLLHHVVHLWPLWIYGAATGHEPTHYWRQAMPVGAAIPLAVLFLVFAYFLCRWMDRTERGGVEAWMRRVCD